MGHCSRNPRAEMLAVPRGRLIAASLSAPENALPLRSRPSAKQKMMLEFRPRNACEILQFFFASAFGTAQKMPRQRGSRRGIVAGLVVGFNDAQPIRAPLREPYAVGKNFRPTRP